MVGEAETLAEEVFLAFPRRPGLLKILISG
jgi:hypothetical protein